MISVIVPIYNVESYLRQCIDSILSQTYMELEILLIDDGSTDTSGVIADSYSDPRIHVFHTENRGLSAARNLGIIMASGEFISFVDPDDWLEPSILEYALSQIKDADIICFNSDFDYSAPGLYTGYEAMILLLNEKIQTSAWGKIYHRHCFDNILFPEGYIHEDTAIMYKLFQQSKQVICIAVCGYHYRIREDSLSHKHDSNNIIDFWLIHQDRYKYCINIVDDITRTKLLQTCALAISRAWAWRNSIPQLKCEYPFTFYEMSSFAKKHFPLSVYLPWKSRVGITLAKHPSKLSFWLANKLLHLFHWIQRMTIM